MKPSRRLGKGLGALMNLTSPDEDGSPLLEEAVRDGGPSVLKLSQDVPRVREVSDAPSEPPVPQQPAPEPDPIVVRMAVPMSLSAALISWVRR